MGIYSVGIVDMWILCGYLVRVSWGYPSCGYLGTRLSAKLRCFEENLNHFFVRKFKRIIVDFLELYTWLGSLFGFKIVCERIFLLRDFVISRWWWVALFLKELVLKMLSPLVSEEFFFAKKLHSSPKTPLTKGDNWGFSAVPGGNFGTSLFFSFLIFGLLHHHNTSFRDIQSQSSR